MFSFFLAPCFSASFHCKNNGETRFKAEAKFQAEGKETLQACRKFPMSTAEFIIKSKISDMYNKNLYIFLTIFSVKICCFSRERRRKETLLNMSLGLKLSSISKSIFHFSGPSISHTHSKFCIFVFMCMYKCIYVSLCLVVCFAFYVSRFVSP